MSKYTQNLSARQLIQYIANDYVELSHDKVQWQRDDFMKICREWLQHNPESDIQEKTVLSGEHEMNKAKIVLSCGHSVIDMDHAFSILTKSTDREGNKAIRYQMVCEPCEDHYRQHGEILDTEDEAAVWMGREKW